MGDMAAPPSSLEGVVVRGSDPFLPLPPRWRNAVRGAASVPAAPSFHFSSQPDHIQIAPTPDSAGLSSPPTSSLLCLFFSAFLSAPCLFFLLGMSKPRHQILVAYVTADPLTSAFVILKAANQLMEGVWGLVSCLAPVCV